MEDSGLDGDLRQRGLGLSRLECGGAESRSPDYDRCPLSSRSLRCDIIPILSFVYNPWSETSSSQRFRTTYEQRASNGLLASREEAWTTRSAKSFSIRLALLGLYSLAFYAFRVLLLRQIRPQSPSTSEAEPFFNVSFRSPVNLRPCHAPTHLCRLRHQPRYP